MLLNKEADMTLSHSTLGNVTTCILHVLAHNLHSKMLTYTKCNISLNLF